MLNTNLPQNIEIISDTFLLTLTKLFKWPNFLDVETGLVEQMFSNISFKI